MGAGCGPRLWCSTPAHGVGNECVSVFEVSDGCDLECLLLVWQEHAGMAASLTLWKPDLVLPDLVFAKTQRDQDSE